MEKTVFEVAALEVSPMVAINRKMDLKVVRNLLEEEGAFDSVLKACENMNPYTIECKLALYKGFVKALKEI